tara:strand:+ start:2680 stop:2862 length:183 start_codon:yes stop_codon:yes gene_type:complete
MKNGKGLRAQMNDANKQLYKNLTVTQLNEIMNDLHTYIDIKIAQENSKQHIRRSKDFLND